LRERRRRGSGGTPWFLLTGFVVGLAIGLLYGYLISPVEYIDSSPSVLNGADKDRYRSLIALAFQADNNLGRARQRLALLKDNSGSQNLAAQAQRLLAANANDQDAHALALLAAALAPQSSPSPLPTPSLTDAPLASPTTGPAVLPSATLSPGQEVQTATPLPSSTPTTTPTITLTPAVTFTPRNTERPTATLGAPFTLKEKKQLCDASLAGGLLEVVVVDSAGQGIPGVAIHVSWQGGENTFYTGLMPGDGPGYADFSMTPQVQYSVRAGEGGEVVSGLSEPTCGRAGSTYSGSWYLVFTQ
jgi:hypothetical protein